MLTQYRACKAPSLASDLALLWWSHKHSCCKSWDLVCFGLHICLAVFFAMLSEFLAEFVLRDIFNGAIVSKVFSDLFEKGDWYSWVYDTFVFVFNNCVLKFIEEHLLLTAHPLLVGKHLCKTVMAAGANNTLNNPGELWRNSRSLKRLNFEVSEVEYFEFILIWIWELSHPLEAW